ncbi:MULTISPECIES: phosphoribosylformylglycinamidine cyclo-ligase [unclassified Pseudodesulfovibrio]|uniref:phosphoribosylformylglycinamidine cyclo-ligase n=1 Tax=unclassified Pseudodesulfovibrio TaxID=2661612 RepID=UPI000FEBE2FF|nr:MULTISPECIES: phosphoribosylformylglycinamidine cyclo-ligase [unclassified Pseudodesulfovibrio]MCJ2164860.1 phosphoribosylformylglycinamidine cyclo-ligase [Pseudodesulfovibrio sp. S3-i]RWU03772.1 phosphoribosylformylglycinamidine cyclo-ligase [Pseudodesulfovibrio sp. S3]
MSDSAKRSQAYTAAGVDIEAGNRFVSRIKDMVKSTFTPGVATDIGGFGGLFKPEIGGMEAPMLVAGTDGVGTKLKLAFMFDRHDTVGIDLVAMSVNDVLVQGAKPLFFLDYFATGKLDSGVAETVVSGVCEGCRQSMCALLGGETAEMPGFYPDGEYDLSGFAVGMVDSPKVVTGKTVTPGDVLIGLGSSGAHSNGWSLIRKILAESGLKNDDIFPGTDKTVAEVLIEPTKIYVKPVLEVLEAMEVKGMVHVTGGGFYDNVPRVLPEEVAASIQFGSWAMLPVFDWVKSQGDLSWPEMLQIFNCGIGYILIVDPANADAALELLDARDDVDAYRIGEIVKRNGTTEQVEVIFP